MSFAKLKNSDQIAENEIAKKFCAEFCSASSSLKYVLGRNIYAESVAKHVNVDGFIDDYTRDSQYLGAPVVKMADVPKDALVLNVAGGSPLSAKNRLDKADLRNLDYFSFYRNSGLSLTQIRFNEDFGDEFSANEKRYEWIYERLNDEESRQAFLKLVSFRRTYDIKHLEGFSWREDVQYFEDFLHLQAEGETFIDVGGFNGFTTLEFIKRCPQFNAAHVFEPEPANYQNCLSALGAYNNVRVHNVGLSGAKATLKIDAMGSASTVSQHGTVTIEVDKLDNLLKEAPTFIKIDIEGEELSALQGARQTIIEHHPRLAISVYHKPGDFWRIPELILSIRNDYEVYLRHYTECIYETVMFFIPNSKSRS
ncbi:FkbM family methyltransferase [Pseudomonas sp. QD4]|uniref:FkbM family methyltransferase n=1 Tax=Pseudomonas sp. QD4 TaxID=3368618 RepID=UPI003B9F9018